MRSGRAEVLLPGLLEPGNAQVRDREADEARLSASRRGRSRPRRGSRRRSRWRRPGTAKSPSGGCASRPSAGCRSARRAGRSRRRRACANQRRPGAALDHGRVVAVGGQHAAGARWCVLRIMPNSDFGCAAPSTIQSALKILCRQCSRVRLREHHQLDVGRIAVAVARRRRRGSRSRRRRARDRASRSRARAPRGPRPSTGTVASGSGARVLEQPPRVVARDRARALGHAVVQISGRDAQRATPGQRPVRPRGTRRRRARCAAPRRGRRRARCRSPCVDQGETVPKRGTTQQPQSPAAPAVVHAGP